MKADMISTSAKVVKFLREDYREFTTLALVYLGAEEKNVNFRRPGALHKARWMAKLISSLKIALLETKIGELPLGTITTRQQTPKMRKFATFVTHVYGVWWLTCKRTKDAPWNDLQLYKRLLNYGKIDKNVAESGLRALNRHLWYLTAEMVPVALFSEVVPVNERKAIADALLAVKTPAELHAPINRFGTGWGKPQFPHFVINLSTRLCDFVGVDSWFTIYHLKLDVSFLQLPVDNWNTDASYMASAKKVSAINVINDAAERGVKLASDFVESARSDDHFQHVIQIVENHRKTTPNLRRKLRLQDEDCVSAI